MRAWRGEAAGEDDAKPALAEERLAVVRVVAVTLNVAVWFALPRHAHDVPWLAHATIALALAYAYGTWLFAPYRRFPPLPAARVMALLDGLFIAVWILATGAYASPYHLLWHLSLVGVSFRFGFWDSVGTSIGYVGMYLGIVLARPVPGTDAAELALRCGYILLVGVVAGLNGQYSRHAAQARDEMGGRMRAAQEAEARIRDLLTAVPDPILIADPEGQVVLANQAALHAFGPDAVGARLPRLTGAGNEAAVLAAMALAPSEPQSCEITLRPREGGETPCEVRVNAVATGDGPRLVVVLRDLTERKRAEAERLAHVERLKEFERLKELEAFRTQFINTAAHELGTPLTPIRMQVHMLRKHADRLAPEQQRSLGILDRNVARLGTLVQEILDSARIQANRLGVDRKPVDLNALVLETVDSFHEAAEQARVRLTARVGPDGRALADEKRVMQVLFNLVGNALKFTPAGGEIVLETRARNGAVLVSVRDSGIGIRKEDAARLFQPFAQINAAGSPKVGAGLGLYISRGLVELHGGRLWCESEGPGEGTTFHFSIPTNCAKEDPATPPPPRAEESPLRRRLRDLV